MQHTAAPPVERKGVEPTGHEHVELARVVSEHTGVAEVVRRVAGRRRQEGVRARRAKRDAVVADGVGEVLRVVAGAHRVEGVVNARVIQHRAGADRALPLLAERQRQRVVLPAHEVAGRGVRPLVATQAAQSLVMTLVEQVEQVERAVVEKRHTVAHELVAARREVLHGRSPSNAR